MDIYGGITSFDPKKTPPTELMLGPPMADSVRLSVLYFQQPSNGTYM